MANKKVLKFEVEDEYMGFLNECLNWVCGEIKMLVWAHDIKPNSELEKMYKDSLIENIDMYCDSIDKAIDWRVLNQK